MSHIHDSGYAASEVRWQDGALCAGLPRERWVPHKEDAAGLAYAKQFCDPCPVRDICLHYALTYVQSGYWGGTDTAERSRLRAKKDRAKCPSCASRRVVHPDDDETAALCLACGLSWQTGSAALPRSRTSVRRTA